MPPKDKNKAKKGVPPRPTKAEERIQRRKEQEKKAMAKKFKRLERERKQKNKDEDNNESFERETSCEKKDYEEDTNLQSSSCTEPIASHSPVQQMIDEFKKDFSKYTNEPSTFWKKSSKHVNVKPKKERIKTSEKDGNDRVPPKEKSLMKSPSLVAKTPKSCSESKKTGNERAPPKEKSLMKPKSSMVKMPKSSFESKKTGNDCAPPKEKSLIKPTSLGAKMPKSSSESKKVSSHVPDDRQKCIQEIYMERMFKSVLHRGEVKTQVEAENNETAEKTVKTTESKEFISNTSKNDLTVDGKSTEDIANMKDLIQQVTHKRHHLQQKLDAKERKVKSLDQQEKILLPLATENRIAVKGIIKLGSPTDECKTLLPFSSYTPSRKLIYLTDDYTNIFVFVQQGSQVAYKKRKIPEIDSFQGVKSSSGTREGQVTERPGADIKPFSEKYDKTTRNTECDSISEGQATGRSFADIKPYSEKYDKTTSSTECDSISEGELTSKNNQTVENKVADNTGTDILIGSEEHDEISTEAKGESSRLDNYSEENDSSGIISEQEQLLDICEKFKKDSKSAFEKYERRISEYMERYLLNSSKI